VEDAVIPAEKLIIFQEEKVDEDESVEALNVAVVHEGAPGDLTSTDFITQQIHEEIEKQELEKIETLGEQIVEIQHNTIIQQSTL
jgi:hypothetical protein